MAKLKMSSAIVAMSGKVGGHVYVPRSGKQVIRYQPHKLYTTKFARLNYTVHYGNVSRQWRKLTPTQVLAWNLAALTYKARHSLGDRISYTGINVFMRINVWQSLAFQTLFVLPPAPVFLQPLVINSIVCSSTTSQLTVNTTPSIVPAGENFFIGTTPCLSPGITKVYGKFCLLNNTGPGGNLNIATNLFNLRYGKPIAGSRVWVEVFRYSFLTGTRSAMTIGSTIVT